MTNLLVLTALALIFVNELYAMPMTENSEPDKHIALREPGRKRSFDMLSEYIQEIKQHYTDDPGKRVADPPMKNKHPGKRVADPPKKNKRPGRRNSGPPSKDKFSV
ncbi:uncharacterized protein LOC102806529 [Saccoglossus kowalevskii]|uniref:Uncharacterized protein LOC102806529 n=1 Tax=Saccoglossus kowalevskii TaxID=10224 RepID=A0ABM0MHB6_SACKO|nr:PREDICTED: uncharacterized protein LOC102806529 [Saccoglossus kowalevskii]